MPKLLQTYVNIAPTTKNSWVTIDVSPYVSQNAVGIILRVVRTESFRRFYVRPLGDTHDDWESYSNVFPPHMETYIFGVNSDKKFQLHTDPDIDFYLVGYFESSEASFFGSTTFVVRASDASYQWANISLASHVPSGTTSAVLLIKHYAHGYKLRPSGSTAGEFLHYSAIISTPIIKLDSQRQFQYYSRNNYSQIYILGYFLSDASVSLSVDPTTIDIPSESAGEWQTLSIPNNGARLAIIELIDTEWIVPSISFRKTSSSESWVFAPEETTYDSRVYIPLSDSGSCQYMITGNYGMQIAVWGYFYEETALTIDLDPFIINTSLLMNTLFLTAKDNLFLKAIRVVMGEVHTRNVVESLSVITPAKSPGFLCKVTQGIDFVDFTSEMMVSVVRDYVFLAVNTICSKVDRSVSVETLPLLDTVQYGKVLSDIVSDVTSIEDFIPVLYRFWHTISEYLSLDDSARGFSAIWMLYQQVVSLMDKAQDGYLLSFTELMEVNSIATSLFFFSLRFMDQVTIVDTESYQYTLNTLFQETLQGTDRIQAPSSVYVFVSDTGEFFVSSKPIEVSTDDDLILSSDRYYQTYVLNTESFLPSIYTNVPFTSLSVLNNKTYITLDDGIYELTGNTDNGRQIETGLRLTAGSLGTLKKKNFSVIYLGYTTDGLPRMRVITDNGEVIYAPVEKRPRIARGQVGVEWTFDLVGINGLYSIELYPNIMSR